jgi:hypothetical protein
MLCRVADLAAKYGLADGKVWMRNWEREWQVGGGAGPIFTKLAAVGWRQAAGL